jgi:hypothetical protein
MDFQERYGLADDYIDRHGRQFGHVSASCQRLVHPALQQTGQRVSRYALHRSVLRQRRIGKCSSLLLGLGNMLAEGRQPAVILGLADDRLSKGGAVDQLCVGQVLRRLRVLQPDLSLIGCRHAP